MDKNELIALANKILNKRASPEEIARYNNWFNSLQNDGETQIKDEELKKAALFARIQEEIQPQQQTIWPQIYRYAAAAVILAFLSFGLYHYLHKNTISKTEYANDIVPGSAKPYLTLANGHKIIIGNNNGILAKQGNVTIQQDTTGNISYSAGNAKTVDAPYNTLTNPRGGKVVSLLLPDGTLAKLEAASSITYQTAFTGKTRNVATTGKVYFAVKYNKNQPFYATTKGQVTKDLGTHFIVEAYDDEPAIKTTLIEGSVAVSKNEQRVLLNPGQQTLATTNLTTQQADIDHETAWINGDFDFNKQNLHSIMRELARVYNIDVTYKDNVENLELDGMISRSHNISAVLEMFEATNKVHFEINGRRVMVIAGQR